MPLASGTRLGSYEVLSLLGAGGMGEVYRARDSRLGRDVAIKVLPADVARDRTRLERFRREAKALAAIDHPNIVTVFSVEEAATGQDQESVHFLTMQLVEGPTLDHVIPASGLPLDRLFQIAAAIADALSAAHDKSIVHRDLKPANVMVAADGRVKVLDFGLAKDLAASGPADATLTSAGHTEHGVVMGTPAYMSPEQVAGRAVDHRSDIFSLGILLYQMASGERPFAGASSAELASAILRDTPPLVTELRGDLPADLARLIRRCLEKDPGQRIQTARDVANECRDLSRQMMSSRGASVPSRRAGSSGSSSGTRADEGFWVTVLPFKYSGSSSELAALAEGLAEEIVTGLSRFSYLRVIARSSTSRDAARYVMEGSLRQAGSQLRVAVQLVDVVSGAHLWAETFDRPFQPDDVFALQDQLVPRIVSTVADQHGVLVHSMSAVIRSKDDTELNAHEAALCVFGFHERMTPEEHGRVRAILERAVKQTPDDGDCWAMLATVYTDEHMFGFNVRPDPLGRAQAAARRAVELSPTSALASQALAQSFFFRRELDACRPVAERTIALNPMDGAISAFIGILLSLSGDWERGGAAAEAARKLNPHFPGWYWLAPAFNAFHKGDYREAIAAAKRVNIPGYFWVPATTAAAFGQLGDLGAAQIALRELLAIRPDIGSTARAEFGKWFQPDLLETYLDGLRKAGLDTSATSEPDRSTTPALAGRSDAPGAGPADEGFWVAVLPFRYSGGNADVQAVADGLSEEIVTGLSRFSYLRVIARNSSGRDRGEPGDVRAVGQVLAARYVVEGSLRQAGSLLRVSVQLIDASSGAHLWAETYDRPFRADDVFALQDDLVPRIVSTLADAHGILPHTMSEALRSKGPDQLSPYEAVLRSFGYGYRRTPEEHAAVRAGLERAVKQAPGYADGWAMLSLVYSEEYAFGFNLQPDPLGRTLMAARRAADAAPSSAIANNALARALFFRKEWQGFRTAAERALELNPLNGPTIAGLGSMMAYAGDWEHGCALVERAATLNPRHPGFYWFPLFYNAYRKGSYRDALSVALKINMPGFFYTHIVLAAVYGQLGERDAAGKALKELLALRSDIALHVHDELGKWYPPELVEQLIEGLRKAGLDVAVATVGPSAPEVSTRAGTTKPSIAVLPFANISADANQDYFSDGLAEEIINLLARISGLKVIARTSSFSFRGSGQDVRRIAESLGVTHVLEGSVRRAGDRVRVTAQLIAAADGGHLWSERYDREVSDLFALQDDIASAITRALQITLTGSPAARRYVPKVAAYEAFLKARHHQAKVTPDSWALAKTYYESAVEIDPEFGLAHVGLGFYWLAMPNFGQVSAHDAVPKARAAAEAALRIDRTLPEAHAVLGTLAAQFDFDWDAAERHFDAPMAREAGSPIVRPLYGSYLFLKGDSDRAIELAERAIAEDPLDVWPRMNLHAYLQAVGRDKEAFEQTQKVLELDPNLVIARVSVAHFHADWGEIDQAVSTARKAYEVGPWYPDARATLAALLKRSGAEEEEARALQQSLGFGESQGDARAQAVYHLLCGDINAGADWTEKAIAARDFSMMYYLRFVVCKPLRASHRWPAIAKMVNWRA